MCLFLIDEFFTRREFFEMRIWKAYFYDNSLGASSTEDISNAAKVCVAFIFVDLLLSFGCLLFISVLSGFHLGLAAFDARTLDFVRWLQLRESANSDDSNNNNNNNNDGNLIDSNNNNNQAGNDQVNINENQNQNQGINNSIQNITV